MRLAQGLGLQVFVGLGDSFRRLGLSSPAVLARMSPLAGLAHFRTVQPGSQPDVLQNQPVALYRTVVERWREREPIDTTIGEALTAIENNCVSPYQYSQEYLDGLSLIGSSRDRQLAFSRKAKKSLAEEEEALQLTQEEIDEKVDGFRAIEKALYEMELRTGDPTLSGLCEAVERWAVLCEERENVVAYLSTQDSMYGAPTMSIGVEAQIILRQVSNPADKEALRKALCSPSGKDDVTDTVAGLLAEGAAKEELEGLVTRERISDTLLKLGYPAPSVVAGNTPGSVANKFGGAALATVRPV